MLQLATTLLAAIDIQDLVKFVIGIVVLGLIVWLLLWLVSYCGVPEPFNKIAKVIIAVVSVLILIGLLLDIAGHPVVKW